MTGRDSLLENVLQRAKTFNFNGIFLMPTGSGKGKFMIECAKILKPNSILYLCNSTELRDVMFKEELVKWGAEWLIPYITFECYQTAYKKEGRHFDLLLADEFDYSLSPEYIKVYEHTTFNNKILVSATLDEHKKVLARQIARIVFEISQRELIEQKVLNDIKFYKVYYDLSYQENMRYLQLNDRFTELLRRRELTTNKKGVDIQLNFLKIQRKQFLSTLESSYLASLTILNSLQKNNQKILTFCGASSMADKLGNGYYTGCADKELLNKFKTGEVKKLSVVEKVTRGANIPEVKNILFNMVDNSKTKMSQKIGRGLRLEIGDQLRVIFMIPLFKTRRGLQKPTILEDWLQNSLEHNMNTRDMEILYV